MNLTIKNTKFEKLVATKLSNEEWEIEQEYTKTNEKSKIEVNINSLFKAKSIIDKIKSDSIVRSFKENEQFLNYVQDEERLYAITESPRGVNLKLRVVNLNVIDLIQTSSKKSETIRVNEKTLNLLAFSLIKEKEC